jgi:hypothetical protein
MVGEQIGVAHLAAERIHAPMAADIHHFED